MNTSLGLDSPMLYRKTIPFVIGGKNKSSKCPSLLQHESGKLRAHSKEEDAITITTTITTTTIIIYMHWHHHNVTITSGIQSLCSTMATMSSKGNRL